MTMTMQEIKDELTSLGVGYGRLDSKSVLDRALRWAQTEDDQALETFYDTGKITDPEILTTKDVPA